jgi:ECF transporter S component (folate family)
MFQTSFQSVKDYLSPDYSRTQWLAYCGLMIAMFLLLSYFNIPIAAIIEIRLGYFALAVAGMIGGPVMGLTVGALGDLLKMLIVPGQGSFFAGFTLCYAFMGMCYGFVFYKHTITVFRAVAGALVEFVTSLFGITACLSILYGMPFKETLISRIPKCIAMLFVSSVLIFLVIKSLQLTLNKAHLLGRQGS